MAHQAEVMDLVVVEASEPEALAQRAAHQLGALSAEMMAGRTALVHQVMDTVMQEGHHYGKIPGTDKPTLLQPGAETLCLTFRFAPRYTKEIDDLPNGHREVTVTCDLMHDGQFVGQGLGCATTMESRYRYRIAARKCPSCGKESIIKGKEQYGGGWICWKKKDGCGAKFGPEDPRITNQEAGRVEHDNPADYYNTILKMAAKRALVAATKTATGASDIFTQDVDTMREDATVQSTAPAPEPRPRDAQYLKAVVRGIRGLSLSGVAESCRQQHSCLPSELQTREPEAFEKFLQWVELGCPVDDDPPIEDPDIPF